MIARILMSSTMQKPQKRMCKMLTTTLRTGCRNAHDSSLDNWLEDGKQLGAAKSVFMFLQMEDLKKVVPVQRGD